MKDVAPILRSLGLLDSEISTYLSALEAGPNTVIDLAKGTTLSRQATYVAIEALEKRGLMSSALVGKKRLYSAEDPERLLAYAKRHEDDLRGRIEELRSALPELKLKAGGEKPVVRVFEGKEGLRAFIVDTQKTQPKEIYEIADLEAVRAVMPSEDIAPVRKELKKIGTFVHGLYAGQPGETLLKADRYVLPKKFAGFKANLTIYEDKIALITLEGKMYSIIIESKALSDTLKILFSMAMESAKRPPKK